MTNYNYKFKKNLIADWIGRDLSAAIRGGVVDSISAKNVLAASLLAISIAVPSVSIAQTAINKEPIFVSEGLTQFLIEPGFSYDINLNTKDEAVSSGISVKEKSELYLKIDSLNIHYEEQNKLADSEIYGITVKDDSFADITAANDIDLKINADKTFLYGIYAESTKTPAVSLISQKGSINIDISDIGDNDTWGISGIRNTSSGIVKLDARHNIELRTTSTKGTDSTQVYAIENQPPLGGKVELSSGDYIKLFAQGNGSSYGIFSSSGQASGNNSVTLTSNGNDNLSYGINIEAITTGTNAFAVNTQYGNVELKANNGGIYLSANGGSSENVALYSAYSNVDLFADENIVLEAKADTSTISTPIYAFYNSYDEKGNLANKPLKLTGKSIFLIAENNSGTAYATYSYNGDVELNANYSSNFSSSAYGLLSSSTDKASSIKVTSSANLFQTGTASIYSSGSNSSVALNANGLNTVIDEASGEDLTGRNLVISQKYGVWTQNSGQISMLATKDNHLETKNYAAYAQSGAISLIAANNYLSSDQDTINAKTNGLITIHANKSNNDNSGSNLISAKYVNGYGEGLAVQALSKGSVEISAQETNSIFGAISSKNEGSSVSVDGKTNTVKSSAVISNAGNLNNATDDKFKDNRVISALYAEGTGAQISLTGEQNYLSTFANSSVHTDLERVVWAYDGADINIDGFTSITTDSYEKSLNSIDIAIAAGTAVNLTEDIVNEDVTDRAQVQIDYANTTDSEGKAVLSSVTGDILSAYAGTVNIAPKSASDGLVVTGNLLAGNNGELTVDIGTNGVLTGRSDDYGDAGFITDSEHTTFFDPAFSSAIYKGGQVKLKMGDNARWNVTGQSWITDISVADGAKNVLIDLVNANTDRNSTAHALTVYNLKGNATFNMSLDGNREVSDMLYIRNANGEYNVNVVDAVTVDDMYKGGLNGLRFATVGAGSKAKFRAFTYDKGALNVEYEVATDSYDNNPENEIYNGTEMSHEKPGSTVVDGLFSYEEGAVATLALNDEAATQAADGTISETTNFKLVDRKDATPSDSGKTIIDHARANYANAVQLDTLNKRQGEMRFSQGHEDGLWARIRHDDIGKRSSFRLDNTMVEVGVDSRYVKETGEFHTGVAFDYMNGDTDYHHISGEGDLDRYGVWFYTTWLGNEGDYTDFIIKCSLIDNEYKIYAPTTGEKITGDYDNNVISVSLEHGKKYSNEESWFIEPQAQLQYAYVTSAEYTNSQGTDVRLDGIHSLIGRVGVRAGKDVTRDNPFTFYARGDIMHEFMGKQDIKAKDATGTMRVRYENDDTWYSAGLGMSYLHNKDKYYFLEAEKVFGGSNTSSYIVSGGVRFLFD